MSADAPNQLVSGRTDGPAPLARNRDFRLLWSAGVLSDVGTYSSTLALPLLVLALTGSPARAGVVGTVKLVVEAAGHLPSGALADRWNRRKIMLTSDAARFVLAATLAASIVAGRATFGLVLAVVSLTAILSVMFSPAETAAIARLVRTDELPAAFARNEARSYAASLGGPPLGGLLFGLGRVVPFITDAVSYLLSLVAIAAIRAPVQVARVSTPTQSVIADIRDGLVHVARSPFLRAVLLIAAPLNLAITGALFTVTLALSRSGTPASLIGVAQGLIGVGGLVGALMAGRVLARIAFRPLVRTVTITFAAMLAAATVLTGRVIMTIPIAVGALLAPSVNAALFGRLAATTPDEIQARVISVVILAATAAAALAPLGVGLLIDHISARVAMCACTASAAVAVAVALTARGLTDPFPSQISRP